MGLKSLKTKTKSKGVYKSLYEYYLEKTKDPQPYKYWAVYNKLKQGLTIHEIINSRNRRGQKNYGNGRLGYTRFSKRELLIVYNARESLVPYKEIERQFGHNSRVIPYMVKLYKELYLNK